MEKVLLKDKIAKKIFTSSIDGKIYVARIIGAVLNKEVLPDDIELIHPEIGTNTNIVDSEVDLSYESKDEYINVEINMQKSKRSINKNQMYICHLYLRDITTHKEYEKAKRVIQINLDNYDYYGKKEFIYKSTIMEEKYHLKEDFIEIYHINLDQLRGEIDSNIRKDKLKRLLYLFVCEDKKKLRRMYGDDKNMGNLMNISKELQEHFDELLYYNREELYNYDDGKSKEEWIEVGYDKGHIEGIEEGKRQEKVNLVKSLIDNNVPVDTISKSTGLTAEKIKEIQGMDN